MSHSQAAPFRELQPRTATAGDLPGLVKLEREAFPSPWPVNLLAAELSFPRALVWVIELSDSGLAGYAAFRLGPGEVELLRLAVAPGQRQRGLATALVEAGLREAGERGAESCFLEVRADNLPAIALYRRLGFVATARRPGYYSDGVDAMLMAKGLAVARRVG